MSVKTEKWEVKLKFLRYYKFCEMGQDRTQNSAILNRIVVLL